MGGEPDRPGESPGQHSQRIFDLMYAVIDRESRLGAALIDLANAGAIEVLSSLLFSPAPDPEAVLAQFKSLQDQLNDPFLNFDPRDGLTGVGVSPLGIVHYFRQYFFELDTFLGPAVGHVWLTPGTTVELIESSTRRTIVEQTVEIAQESTMREVGGQATGGRQPGVKEENKSDSKLGFSTTVNQSWPTGDATATGSFNLDTTQSEARDTTYKRMREQSEKISTEIRSSYKSTFKTVTETTDVSSKRYVISNPGIELQNYELRRKMRRVGGPGAGHRHLPVLGDLRRRPRPRARARQPRAHRQAAGHHPTAVPDGPADPGTKAWHPVRHKGGLGWRGPTGGAKGHPANRPKGISWHPQDHRRRARRLRVRAQARRRLPASVRVRPRRGPVQLIPLPRQVPGRRRHRCDPRMGPGRPRLGRTQDIDLRGTVSSPRPRR